MSASSRRSADQRRGGVQRSLSEERIVEAALTVTRDVGLDGLTMAALARRLGVGVMTLYSYFRSRTDLLSAMAERAVIALYDQHPDLAGAGWEEELRVHYHAIRESLKRHPALADLLFFRGEVLPGGAGVRAVLTEHVGRHVDAMVRGGIEPSLAYRAVCGLSMFALAASLREEDLSPQAPGQWLVTLSPGAEASAQPTSPFPPGPAPDVRFGSDDEFDLMLDLVLRGLKATIKD
jgi:AcrR family transcriptional regulator